MQFKRPIITFILTCYFILTSTSTCHASDNLNGPHIDLFKLAQKLKQTNPDSCSTILNTALELALIHKDTLSPIQILILDKDVNGNLGRYYKSYSNLIHNIKLAKEANLTNDLVRAYIQLVRQYGFLKRKEKALLYINRGQDLMQQQIKDQSNNKSRLYYPYYAKICLYRVYLVEFS